MSGKKNVYGEGNYEASRQYNAATKEFVKKADIEQAARDAAPRTPAEAKEMLAAEQEGLRHSKDKPIPTSKFAKKPPKAGGAARK
jgi:hypothetical protein